MSKVSFKTDKFEFTELRDRRIQELEEKRFKELKDIKMSVNPINVGKPSNFDGKAFTVIMVISTLITFGILMEYGDIFLIEEYKYISTIGTYYAMTLALYFTINFIYKSLKNL